MKIKAGIVCLLCGKEKSITAEAEKHLDIRKLGYYMITIKNDEEGIEETGFICEDCYKALKNK